MVYLIIGIIVWLYLLSVCKRGQLTFYHFIIGSIGLFIICMFQVPYIEDQVISMFTYILQPLGNATGIWESFPQYGLFFVDTGNGAMSFSIDLECSGIIEMLVFVCLLFFFPVYKTSQKISISIIGVLCIILFNCLRMISVLSIIYYFGTSYYLFAHSVVGRILFYVLTIILYYTVFTKKQITEQRVGNFSYESSDAN